MYRIDHVVLVSTLYETVYIDNNLFAAFPLLDNTYEWSWSGLVALLLDIQYRLHVTVTPLCNFLSLITREVVMFSALFSPNWFATREKSCTFAIPNGGIGWQKRGTAGQAGKKAKKSFAESKNLSTFADPNGERFRKRWKTYQKRRGRRFSHGSGRGRKKISGHSPGEQKKVLTLHPLPGRGIRQETVAVGA